MESLKNFMYMQPITYATHMDEFYVNLWDLMHWYTCKSLLNTLGTAVEQLAGCHAKQTAVRQGYAHSSTHQMRHSASTLLASYPGHVGGGKSGLVSTVCACAKNPMISWGIVYHRLRTVNLYRIAPKHIRLELIPRTLSKKWGLW